MEQIYFWSFLGIACLFEGRANCSSDLKTFIIVGTANHIVFSPCPQRWVHDPSQSSSQGFYFFELELRKVNLFFPCVAVIYFIFFFFSYKFKIVVGLLSAKLAMNFGKASGGNSRAD